MQVGVHLCAVRLPTSAGGSVIEGVGVRVDPNQGELAVDHAGEHFTQVCILCRQLDIGPDLGSGVA